MKKLLVLAVLLAFKYSFSQSQDDIVYNLGISASTPGFSILELSPTTVERPRDPNNFALLLQNASENFTMIPKNYAIEFAPILLFKPVVSIAEFKSAKFSDNFNQSFLISAATTTTEASADKSELTRMGVGFKFSFLRGDYSNVFTTENDNYKKAMKELEEVNKSSRDEIKSKYSRDEILTKLEKEKTLKTTERITVNAEINIVYAKNPLTDEDQRNIDSLKKIRDSIDEDIEKRLDKEINERAQNIPLEYSAKLKDQINKLRETISKISFIREGFKWDFSAAVAYDYKNQNFNEGRLSKIAAWMTLGSDYNVTKKSSQTFLTVLKVTNTPDVNDTVTCSCGQNIVRNSVTNMDFGARYILDFSQFSFSLEGLLRFEKYKSTDHRVALNLSYSTDNNTLSFTFGRDFDGTTYKKGDLIAALNFLVGLGSKRPL